MSVVNKVKDKFLTKERIPVGGDSWGRFKQERDGWLYGKAYEKSGRGNAFSLPGTIVNLWVEIKEINKRLKILEERRGRE